MTSATMQDVADLAGVSIKTVSRVINDEPNVRRKTRENVEAAIRTLNYRPNKAARNLASHHSHLIGLVYDDPSSYEVPSSGYIIQMQLGVLRACRARNFELLIHPCRYRERGVGMELKLLLEQVRPDGIVLAPPLSNMPKIVRAIRRTGTPLVRLSPGTVNGDQLSISTDDREVSAEMTRYLASLGHERIAFITGHPSHKAVGNRFLGYRDGLKKAGLRFAEKMVAAGDNSIRSGEACAEQLLSRKRRPTAIFAANDDMAAGVIRVAQRLGIRVPEDLSVAGCDDITLAQQIYPSLTTIEQPGEAMAEMAAKALIEAMRDGRPPTGSEIVPARLKIRDSTGPCPPKAT